MWQPGPCQAFRWPRSSVQELAWAEPRLVELHIEKEAIEQAIASCDGNIPKAAALLEISPSTIYRKKQGWEEASLA